MFRCPSCKELGYGSDQKPCTICLGWGVLASLTKTCDNCKGKEGGCYKCKTTGKLYDPKPYIELEESPKLVREIPMERIREAITRLRTGYEEEPAFPFTLAVAGRLVDLSQMHTTQYGEPAGAWLQTILRADVLVIEPSGMWVKDGKYIARIHRHPLAPT